MIHRYVITPGGASTLLTTKSKSRNHGAARRTRSLLSSCRRPRAHPERSPDPAGCARLGRGLRPFSLPPSLPRSPLFVKRRIKSQLATLATPWLTLKLSASYASLRARGPLPLHRALRWRTRGPCASARLYRTSTPPSSGASASSNQSRRPVQQLAATVNTTAQCLPM